MFVRVKTSGFDANLPGHAEMNPKPVMAREFEEHPFAAGPRAQKFLANQSSMKFAGVCSAKNPVSRMQPNVDNFFAKAGVPLFAIPFDLGQFGHRQNIAVDGYAASSHPDG